MSALSFGGSVAIYALLSGEFPVFLLLDLVRKNTTLHAYSMFNHVMFKDQLEEGKKYILERIDKARIRLIVDKVFNFNNIIDAYNYMLSNKQKGKLMKFITDDFIKNNITYLELRNALKLAFRDSAIESPPKLAYDYKNRISNEENTLLFMPAWDNKKYIGVKLITATPHNSARNIPYLNGLYVLFNAENGEPLAAMDAKLITNMRTAATSVLATTFLAKKNASSVLILGNGSLSPYYISAYASMPGIKNIYLWGRNFNKSKKVIEGLNLTNSAPTEVVSSYKDLISSVDIVSCITSSYEPLVHLEDTTKGQHYDLVGAYTENMQEVSTDLVASSSVFTDNFDITLQHAGELVKTFFEGKMSKEDIKGDFKFLCKDDAPKRLKQDEITLFKCTGMALEDLVFAGLVYEKNAK